MAAIGDAVNEVPKGGFSFELCKRNDMLEKEREKMGYRFPNCKPVKTGTTIAGIVYKDGIVLGADTRATAGTVVADKNCAKIHYLAKNMYCCGAGTAADTEYTTDIIAAELELHRLSTNRISRVSTACRLLKQYLYRYEGHIGAYLVLGGVDNTGPHLFTIHAHGSTDKLPYVSMGSGSLAAMAVFEDRYKPNMELEDAKQLVRDAIAGGIFNDLGSGSNVDLCVITRDGRDYIRPFDIANSKGERKGDYTYPRGTTAVLHSDVRRFTVTSEHVRPLEEAMET